MKMKELYLNGGDLIGLGEDGVVYIYRPAREPFAAQEPVPYEPCADDRRLTLREQEILKEGAYKNQVYAMNQANQCQSGQALGSINCAPALWPYQETPVDLERTVCGKQAAMEVRQGAIAGWRAKYIDGCTAGWEPLSMTISKVVPHPGDPTKNERA